MERQAWLSSGHDVGQCAPIVKPRSSTSTALQTDNPVTTPTTMSISIQTSTISHLDASVQVSEPSPSLSQLQKVIMEPLDWAEDAKSLPTIPLPPSLYPPHDLSVLHSSSSSPFSCLQHRSKCFTHFFHQSHHCHSHFNFNSFYSSHYNSFKQSRPYLYTKTYSQLN